MGKIGAPSITQFNPAGQLYLNGSDKVDGGVRFVVVRRGKSGKIRGKLETNADRVWNAGQMEMGQGSLFLGPNVSVRALGASVEFRSLDGDVRSLPLDIPISDAGTTTPRVIRVGQRFNRIPGQVDFSVDTVSTEHLRPATTLAQGFVLNLYLKVGAVAPTEEVSVIVTLGLVAGGEIIHEQFYPASRFPANTEVQLEDTIDLGTFVGDEVLATISSASAFSLLGDVSARPWVAVDIQFYQYEEAISTPTGTDKILVDVNGAVMTDYLGNVMLSNPDLFLNAPVT